MRTSILCLCLLIIISGSNLYSQTSLNPDISAVGDFRVFSHDDLSRPDEKEKLNLSDPEVELNINGYLNPYARADVVMGWHGEHNAEIEEAYATILRGLPFNMNLRAGKYLLEFGRLNSIHPHAYSFIERPLPHEAFFGEEGLSDMAVRASFTLPTGRAFTEIMGGLLKGDALAVHAHDHAEDAEEESESDEKRDLGFFGRLTTSLALSESAEFAIGGSVLNAVHGFAGDEEGGAEDSQISQLRSWLIGTDLKYKYKPSQYKSLQIEAEGLLRFNEQDEGGDDLTSYGAYGYLDYRFNQKYNIGGILEWVSQEEAHHHESESEHEIERLNTRRFGLFIGFAPLEETSLIRLAGHWTDPDEGDSFWEATLQLVISLGPHKPHNF